MRGRRAREGWLAFLALPLLWGCDDPPPAPPPPVQPSNPQPVQDSEPHDPLEFEPTPTSGPSKPADVSGRLVTEAGDPVPNVGVELVAGVSQEAFNKLDAIAAAKTGDDGRFTLAAPKEDFYRLRFQRVEDLKTGFWAYPYFDSQRFYVFSGQQMDLGDLPQRRWGAEFVVRCNYGGKPIAGQRIWLWQPETTKPTFDGSPATGITDDKGEARLRVPMARKGQIYLVVAEGEGEYFGFKDAVVEAGWNTLQVEMALQRDRGGCLLVDQDYRDRRNSGEPAGGPPRVYLTPFHSAVCDKKYGHPNEGNGWVPVETRRFYSFLGPIPCDGEGGYWLSGIVPDPDWFAVSVWRGFKNHRPGDGVMVVPVAAGGPADHEREFWFQGLSGGQIVGSIDPSVEGVRLSAVHEWAEKKGRPDARGIRMGVFLMLGTSAPLLSLAAPDAVVELKGGPAEYALTNIGGREYSLFVGGVRGNWESGWYLSTMEAPAFVVPKGVRLASNGSFRIDIDQDVTAAQVAEQYGIPKAAVENKWKRLKLVLEAAGIDPGR